MQRQPLAARHRQRIAASLPFVESLARRVAASMPHSIELGDLVQDGMIGLIDAACRFDEDRGIKFETFAERRVRGAMIDALRKDAWPRGVRRQRRELEAARETLRRELGCEPSLADLAAKVGSTIEVLIDRVDEVAPQEAGTDRGHFDAPHAQHHHDIGATGRSKADAPEIDGEVHLRDAVGLKSGDFVRVRVEDADEHDLYGVPQGFAA